MSERDKDFFCVFFQAEDGIRDRLVTGVQTCALPISVRMDIRRIGTIKDKEEIIGNSTRVKVVKNKVSPPFKVVEFDLMYGKGISKSGELIDLGSKAEIIEKSGAWYAYKGERIGQGRENAKIFLEKNFKIAAEIEMAIRTKAGLISKKIEGNPTVENTDSPKKN